MKSKLLLLFLLFCTIAQSQSLANSLNSGKPNLFIITTDGFRWQEVFKGADLILIRNSKAVKDTGILIDQFWHENLEERRKKLLPFFWSVIAKKGRLSGNKDFGNEVKVANLYKISYPGYNEILTGFADKNFIPNLAVQNRNSNLLEYFNKLEAYSGRVVAFSSWNILPFILNEKRSGITVNGGYESLDESDSLNNIINQLQNGISEKKHTRQDLLTFASAKNYIESKHPKMLFLGLGETDEFAHLGRYDQYLQKAHQFDQMIAELWYYVQTDPFYKDNTVFVITTDHGRGSKTLNWAKHGFWVKGSGEAWMAMIGPGILAEGEIKYKEVIYQKQIAASVSQLLGEKFQALDHSVAEAFNLPSPPTKLNVVSSISFTAAKK
ncbi:MAG TPA: alkaline phosphatase family protein [Sediminibacterium sp.]|nr:alkaline phosphatase family protein [Sediminibacterium sp.]